MPNRNRSFARRKIFKLPILQFVGLTALVALLIVTVVGAVTSGSFDIRNYAKERAKKDKPTCRTDCKDGYGWEYNRAEDKCKKKKVARCSTNNTKKTTDTCPGQCITGISNCTEVKNESGASIMANSSGSCTKGKCCVRTTLQEVPEVQQPPANSDSCLSITTADQCTGDCAWYSCSAKCLHKGTDLRDAGCRDQYCRDKENSSGSCPSPSCVLFNCPNESGTFYSICGASNNGYHNDFGNCIKQ